MSTYLLHIFVPMILANVLHMMLVKRNALKALAIPVSRPLFGDNKTWRGFVIVPGLNALFLWGVNLVYPLFGQVQALWFGCLLGIAYCLFELPNSWLKRQLGIASGAQSARHTRLFMLLDKTDSALGVSLLSKWLFGLSWLSVFYLFLLSIAIHALFSLLLVAVGIKKRF